MQDTLEFFKLDTTDRKVLFWMMDTNPQSLWAWIDHIAERYSGKNKAVIDTEKLFQEVIVEIPENERIDFRKSWRPKRILLVDDESIFNFLHRRMLELTGVTREVHTTLNGIQAMDFLKVNATPDNLPDVILLDLTMPVMDGFAFLDAFNKLDLPGKENISIVVITSSINNADRVKAREMGITHYLIKPIDERELCAVLIGE